MTLTIVPRVEALLGIHRRFNHWPPSRD